MEIGIWVESVQSRSWTYIKNTYNPENNDLMVFHMLLIVKTDRGYEATRMDTTGEWIGPYDTLEKAKAMAVLL